MDLMQGSDNSGPNIGVNEIPWDFKMLSEDVHDSVTSNESNKGDVSIRNSRDLGKFKPGRQYCRLKLLLSDDLKRCLSLEVAVAVIRVMIELEIPGLGSEVTVTPKPLDSKETLVIGVIKAFDRSITPRFSSRNEDGLDPQRETKSENNPKGARVAIAPAESQLVVELEKVGHPHGLPASDQSLGNRLIVLGSLGMKKDAVTVKVHDIERKETAIVLDIARTHQIGLMNVVASQGDPEIRVRHSFGGIRCFF